MYVFAFIFLVSCFLMIFAGKWVVSSLSSISRFLGWKEFIAAFFAISLGAVAPEFFIGVTSALHGAPELSLGNILGQNILLLSVAVAFSAIVLKDGIKVESQTVKAGSIFAVVAAILPIILLLDGNLSRIDGLVLVLTFVAFSVWLFSKKERFKKVYEEEGRLPVTVGFKKFAKSVLLLFSGIFLIIISAEGIIKSSLVFSEGLVISIPFVGMMIVALGTGLPETYVAVNLARKGQSWMILGGLMGAVAMSSTLVLGIVSIIHPIFLNISELPQFALARIFLLLCSVIFLLVVSTGKRISTKEGFLLLIIYALFVFLSFMAI